MKSPRLLAALMICLLAAPAMCDELWLNDALTPAEQYRRLGLVLLIGEAVEAPLYAHLQQAWRRDAGSEPVDPDRLKSPLLRIVDQPSMLAGAAHLFRIAREHGAEVAQRMTMLTERHPESISALSSEALREDAILVRMAVADSMEYAGLGEDPGLEQALVAYRARTLALRNLLEFAAFDRELERLTAEAIAAVGSQLDAYQRMFDDEVGDGTFEHHIRTAERPYLGRSKVDADAARLAEEVMEGVVLSESQPNP